MKIVFTGGGTGGHVIPNLAVIAALRQQSPHTRIFYIGSAGSIEEQLVRRANLEFFAVATGKLRRYFSWQNAVDALRIPRGVWQAVQLLRRLQPDAVFAKGGFVSVPTALAAWMLKIPLVIHESDASFGLATKICAKFATKICTSFPLTAKNQKTIFTGNPVRAVGSADRGRRFLKFQNSRPLVLIVGGSSGSAFLNNLILKIVPRLLPKMNLVWISGSEARGQKSEVRSGFKIFEFLDAEYLDVLAAADLVISRAGANALFEFAAATRPSILIPLPTAGSRGDQIENAEIFAQAGASKIWRQEKVQPDEFARFVLRLMADKNELQKMSRAAQKLAPHDAAQKLAKIVRDVAQNSHSR